MPTPADESVMSAGGHVGIVARIAGLAEQAQQRGVDPRRSATLLPGSSEAVLAGILATGTAGAAAAVAVATAGNTLGSLANWGIGRFLAGYRDHPRFPVKRETYDRAAAIYGRWGAPLLLFSWVPLIGDPLTVVAGVLRTPLWLFLPLVATGKLMRYLAIAGLLQLF